MEKNKFCSLASKTSAVDYAGRRSGGLRIHFDELGFFNMHLNLTTRVFSHFFPIQIWLPRQEIETATLCLPVRKLTSGICHLINTSKIAQMSNKQSRKANCL